MPNNTSFPGNSTEALAYLYVKNQDLSGKSPKELYAMFQNAYNAIQAISGQLADQEETQQPEVRWL